MMELQIYFDNKPWSGQTDVFIVNVNHRGEREIVKPMQMVFTPIDEHTKHEPSLTFSMQAKASGFFEALVRALAEAGYKQENPDSGELKATKIHLADMQRMVFSK